MENISKRLRQIVELGTQEVATRRFNWLSNNTNVSAEAWRSFWNSKQKPSAEMIESAAKLWPEHAYWLATNMDDSKFGHSAPKEIGFPEKSKIQESSVHYFAAVNAWSVENENFAKIWLEDDTNELSQEMHDKIKRNKHQLETNNEQVNKNKIKVSLLDDLRWIEILIDVYLPKLGYEDTERMLQLAKNKLEQIEKNAKENEIEIRNDSIKSKIHDLDTQIARHHEWNTWHEKSMSTNAKT